VSGPRWSRHRGSLFPASGPARRGRPRCPRPRSDGDRDIWCRRDDLASAYDRASPRP